MDYALIQMSPVTIPETGAVEATKRVLSREEAVILLALVAVVAVDAVPTLSAD
jgi:hypothetical protein